MPDFQDFHGPPPPPPDSQPEEGNSFLKPIQAMFGFAVIVIIFAFLAGFYIDVAQWAFDVGAGIISG